jgi:hypothetical protein
MNTKSLHIPRRGPMVLLLLALLLITGQTALAADELSAALSTAGGNVTVGDPIQLVLTVQHPASYQVIPPDLEQAWGDFSVRSVSPASMTANPDGTATTTFAIDARMFRPGTVQTPPLDVKVADTGGHLAQVTAASVPVTVTSVLKAGDTELRDIKEPAALPLAAPWPWIVAAAVAALALAGALFWFFRSRLGSVVDKRLPHERALDTLNAIEALHLPQQGRYKEHYSLISGCMRSYVEQACGVPALERTTGELEADLAVAGLAPDLRAALMALLQDSDIVKFTTLTPDEERASSLLNQARAIVQATAPQPATAATTTPATHRHSGQQAGRPAQVTEAAL